MGEAILRVVRSYEAGASVVLVVPKDFDPQKGRQYIATQGEDGQIIYTPLRLPSRENVKN